MSNSVRASERKRTDISLSIRRRTHSDGLILFSGEFSRDSAFISLAIRNDALEFRFNPGTGKLNGNGDWIVYGFSCSQNARNFPVHDFVKPFSCLL